MAAQEGIRRLGLFGGRLLFLGGALIFGAALFFLLGFAVHELIAVALVLAFLSAYPLVGGALIWLFTWIAEGFLQAPRSHNLR